MSAQQRRVRALIPRSPTCWASGRNTSPTLRQPHTLLTETMRDEQFSGLFFFFFWFGAHVTHNNTQNLHTHTHASNNRLMQVPLNNKPAFVCIRGARGMGKTSMCRFIAHRNAETNREVPVFCVSITKHLPLDHHFFHNVFQHDSEVPVTGPSCHGDLVCRSLVRDRFRNSIFVIDDFDKSKVILSAITTTQTKSYQQQRK